MKSSQLFTKMSLNPCLIKRLDLSFLSSVFVLFTHLTLLKLHKAEKRLISLSATLMYDVTEAKLILKKTEIKKCTALELQCKRLWTKEVKTLNIWALANTQKNEVVKKSAAKKHQINQAFKWSDSFKTVVIIENFSTKFKAEVTLQSLSI